MAKMPDASKTNAWRRALPAAFSHTLPICAGFLVLGMSYGLLMKASGFPFYFPILTSITVFAGSMELVLISLLLSRFDLLQAVVLTLMINARHIFYGISMLDKYRHTGWKKPYLIFGMCDESFSINYAAEPPEGVDRSCFMFLVTLLDHSYWVIGATLGGIFGSILSFNTEGLDFVMTAMFVVILLEQWRQKCNRLPALLGLGITALSLILLGADRFLLPAMGVILLTLALLKRPLEKGGPHL